MFVWQEVYNGMVIGEHARAGDLEVRALPSSVVCIPPSLGGAVAFGMPPTPWGGWVTTQFFHMFHRKAGVSMATDTILYGQTDHSCMARYRSYPFWGEGVESWGSQYNGETRGYISKRVFTGVLSTFHRREVWPGRNHRRPGRGLVLTGR